MDENIIGARITEARKALGLSQIELAQLTGFGKTRISNWETGFRTPKINEAKVLQQHLRVFAGYLLGLTNNKDNPDELTNHQSKFKSIPIFGEKQLVEVATPIELEKLDPEYYFPLSKTNECLLEQNAFAIELFDSSMAPEFNNQDVIVFIASSKIRHNDCVLVKVKGTNDILFRKYFIDNTQLNHPQIKLIPTNCDWITHVVQESDLIILGVMSHRQRLFL